VRWAAHNVKLRRTGSNTFTTSATGDLDLGYEAMEVSADAGLTLKRLHPEPANPTAQGIALLANWAATEGATAPAER
jgi:hypothetical protein